MGTPNQRDESLIDRVNRLTADLAELQANVISRWGRIPHVATDPTSPPDGAIWTRSDDFGMRYRASSATKVLPLGYVGSAALTANTAALGTNTDLGLSVAFTAVAGRRYKITASIYGGTQVGAGATELYLVDVSNNKLAGQIVSRTAIDTPNGIALTFIQVPGAGAVTYKLRNFTTATNFTYFAGATVPALLVVEDIGT